MSAQEFETALKTGDGREQREKFVALNFRKQLVQPKDGLIQTETIEIQTAPELKETVNSALFKAAKKKIAWKVRAIWNLKVRRRILKRQNAILTLVQTIGV